MRAGAMVLLLVLGLIRPGAAETTKLVIGFAPSDDFVPIMVAKDTGIFAAHGIDATIMVVPLISNVPPALVSGSMQIGSTTGPTLVEAQENGLNFVVVSGMSRLDATHQLVSVMVGMNSPIKSVTDLKGKRVGVPGLNSLLDLTFRRWLVNNNVPPDSVAYVETTFPAMGDLLRSGQLDAVVIKEPARGSAERNGAGRVLADYPKEVSPDLLNTLLIAEQGWAMSHLPVIAAFRASLDEAIAAYQKDPAAGRAIEAHYMKAAPGPLPKFSTIVTVQDLRFQQDLAKQFGLIKGDDDPASLLLK
jgi:NitT/TauT family transport system substrate-binding protein